MRQYLLPHTYIYTYVQTVYQQISQYQRIIQGIDGMVKDTVSLHVLMQSIGNQTSPVKGNCGDGSIMTRFQYYCELDSAAASVSANPNTNVSVTNNSIMCRWYMKTENAMERGARQEVYKHGMIEAVFTPQNKLLRLEMTFDVMSFMQQLKQASGLYSFPVVPNTPNIACMDDQSDCRMVVDVTAPYLITYVNQNWCSMLGYVASQVMNQSLTSFIGSSKEAREYNQLMKSFVTYEAGCILMTCHAANGTKSKLFMKLYPLYASNTYVSHFLIVFDPVSAPVDSFKSTSYVTSVATSYEPSESSSVTTTSQSSSEDLNTSTNVNNEEGSNMFQMLSRLM